MQPYKNLSGNSGVRAWETGEDHILVWFLGKEEPYRYSYAKAGKRHVNRMKTLALKGVGLSTYISRFTRELFDEGP